MAEIPSPVLIGVQRVVIACEGATGLTEIERNALCNQLVKKAGVLTDLPVSAASAGDLDPTNLARQSEQLLLRVTAKARTVDAGRKKVALSVIPVRAATAVPAMPAMESSASFVKVQGDWLLQGPVDAFTKLLGSGPRKLRKPVRSEI
jgi:hypothetical protein